MSVREFFVLLAMCVVWGFHFVVIKVAIGEIPPIFYAALRMALVAALMAPFLRWRRGRMAPVFAGGLCFGAFNYAFLFSGMKLTSASATAIAVELHVVFATLLSVIFLGERIGWRRISGVGLAVAGVAVIALGRETGAGGPAAMTGVGLVACAAFVEATGAILVKKADGFRPQELLAWFAAIGAPTLLGLTALLEEGQWSAFAAADPIVLAGAIAYSAILSSVFGHTAYYWLIRRLPISTVAPSNLLTTLLAVAFSIWILGDPFTLRFLVGSILTLIGVAIILFRGPRAAAVSPAAAEPVIAAQEGRPS